MTELPSGTVTFLLSDVEGSTALWEEAPDTMRPALARHDLLFEAAVARHGGTHIRPRGEGDSRFAVFSSAPDAVTAALTIQRAFEAEDWPTPRPIKVRIGVHTGEAELRDGDYYGSAVNRCARLRGIGHGGQILLSEAVTALVRDDLPVGASLLNLGGHRLKDLSRPEQVQQLVAPDVVVDFPPLVSLDARPHNLPLQTTTLLGRDHEVQGVRSLLLRDDVRLVTLTGPGGTGKTRLSLQVAADLLDRFEDGAFFVELAPISDPALVLSTIAQILDVRDVIGRPLLDVLIDSLRGRQLLLVLDNFEQVLAAATVVDSLLRACPRLCVLVTSRAALQLRGEHEYPVPPLALPDSGHSFTPESLSQYGAVALFIDRATAIKPDFMVTNANAPAVAEICARLDGLPLAIELAAARIRLLSPEAMLSRLGHGLTLLSGGRRDLPARQQTLRSAIAWSYELLGPPDQSLFRRLCVFTGGWTLDAAEVICGPAPDQTVPGPPDGAVELDRFEVLDGLTTLVEHSLVARDPTSSEQSRFRMLETIREYGREQLEASDPAAAEVSERAGLQQRHAAYFLELAERAEPHLVGRQQVEHLDQLEGELDNVRSALAWSRAGAAGSPSVEMGLRLATALWRFWELRGHVTEGWECLADLLALQPEPTVARARALNVAGYLAWLRGDVARSRALTEECLALGRALGDAVALGWGLIGSGILACLTGDPRGAAVLLDESLAVVGPDSHYHARITALYWRSELARAAGADEQAEALLDDAMVQARGFDDAWMLAFMLLSRACIQLERGAVHGVEGLINESLALRREISDTWGIVGCVEAAGWAGALRGAPTRAARLFGAAEALRESAGTGQLPGLRANYDRAVTAAQSQLDDATFRAAWAGGRAVPRDQVIDEILVAPAADGASAVETVVQLPATAPGASALTVREREVAALVGRGLTSRQIAERLVMSVRTADSHAEHIREKLGLRSRRQIAAWAIAHGLVTPGVD